MAAWDARVGRFIVCEHLGSGDLGCAYRAFEPGLGSVVVKLLTGLQDAEAGDRERFVTLAWRLATVRHPNLPVVFEFGNHEGAPYLVVQHLRGSARARRLRPGPIERPAAMLATLRAVASAVDHAHGLGLVHGSIRPRQVLLEDDHPFLTDLGLAGLRWPGPGHVNAITLAAAAPYAAPELVAGGELSAPADRYAFATMAYRLLTGRTPFQGELHQVVSAQLLSEPPAPSRLNRALGGRFDDVLLRGLAKLPEDRWSSCIEMTDALAEALPCKAAPIAARIAHSTPAGRGPEAVAQGARRGRGGDHGCRGPRSGQALEPPRRAVFAGRMRRRRLVGGSGVR
jgi:serine/threonine-protein kinase